MALDTAPPARSGPVRVALLGCGVVGTQVVRLLRAQASDLAARVGAPLELIGIGVRHPDIDRGPDVDAALLTTDADALVHSGPDIVIELIGGLEPARGLVLAAIGQGASVVTANKALLAADGAALHAAAADRGVDLYYEASVAGAIPLLRPLRESLAGDQVRRVLGIVNGTSNFILTRMDESGATFADALTEATKLGYAEADPTADIEGFDGAAKAAILAGIAFHTRVTVDDVHREGISHVTPATIASARELGYVVKALAIGELAADGHSVGVRVHPAMIPRTHPLAGVRDAYNAVFVESAAAGRLMFYGQGAGGTPTASAVLGDLVAAGRNLVQGGLGVGESTYAERAIAPVAEARTRYHIAIEVQDRVGVLEHVAHAFAGRDVSIRSLRQEGHADGASLVVVTHVADDGALAATVEDIRRMPMVRDVSGVLRVEGESS